MKKLMCGSDYDQVEEACNILIEDLGIKFFPVNCFEVAWLLGIEIKKYSEIPQEDREKVVSKTEDGYSAKIGDRFFIYYNDLMPQNRIKFTIWHEIAHIQLGHLDSDCTKNDDLMEEEANHFAAYIMAPIAFLIMYNLNNPIAIADTCEISIDLACNVYEHYCKAVMFPNVRRRIMNNRITQLLVYSKEGVA